MEEAPDDPPHRKTCRRYNTPGHAHYLTFSCFSRRPFLSRDRTREWLVESLSKAVETHDFHLWAWVIMPEHAHVIAFAPRPEYDVSRFLYSIKFPVARKAITFLRWNAPEF